MCKLPTFILAGICCLWLMPTAQGEMTGVEKLAAARTQFRVCAAPDNLPFSNRDGEGFDNKIAQLLAAAEGKPLVYAWWPLRRGFISNTLNRWECDVVIGVPTGYELAATTRPYYCSTYVGVQRAGEPPALAGSEPGAAKRIGVMVQTPPLDLLLRHHVDPRVYLPIDPDGQTDPARIVDDVAAGRIDAAFVWGPLAGYFASREPTKLSVSPLTAPTDSDIRLSFPISVGVRHGDRARLDDLNALIDAHRTEINSILRNYGVPLVDDPAQCAPPQHAAEGPAASLLTPALEVAPTSGVPRIERIVEKTEQPSQKSETQTITCNGAVTLSEVQKLAAAAPPSSAAPPYRVRDGNKVDAKTYEGWIRFSAFCQQCHGMGGVGSALAPDLAQALKTLDEHQFRTIVSCGLKGNLGIGVMPAWQDNPNIDPYLDDLWAYLKARADGALGPGRPEKLQSASSLH
jgi:mxaJ protein